MRVIKLLSQTKEIIPFVNVFTSKEAAVNGCRILKVKFTCPRSIVAGTDIGSQVKLKVWNAGNAPAAGTDTAGSNGYMVDLMLSTDTSVPAGWATYSPNF